MKQALLALSFFGRLRHAAPHPPGPAFIIMLFMLFSFFCSFPSRFLQATKTKIILREKKAKKARTKGKRVGPLSFLHGPHLPARLNRASTAKNGPARGPASLRKDPPVSFPPSFFPSPLKA